MSYRNKLKIGEFSRLMQVTVKTLRHYEHKGLLIPDEIDEWTGYRYYNIEQMQKLSLRHRKLLDWRDSLNEIRTMEEFSFQSLPEINVASHREVIANYDALGPLCYMKIGPAMMEAGCRCTEPGYCFTIDHNGEYKTEEIDIEYCEQVEELLPDTDFISFKRLPAIPKALCLKHIGPYDRFYESFTRATAYLESQGLRIAGDPRFSYIDGAWNQEDPEKWVSVIQIPVE
ncbi:MAG: MerR family transcriptional regulator [Bacteroidales bacterium]|nr:MerR family transcriptional regulator [Bacteroidales bacterium]MDD6751302.1 MerR family transcriptional regulator [Bacteroidales bacterium]MDD6809996.1 MerR family transcriptional regulator [Bacteroidales bacterium]